MPATDLDAALQAIAALEPPSPGQLDAQRAITAMLHNGEPFVDVDALFALYDALYFRNLLLPRVEVLWSPRLTLVCFSRRFMRCFPSVSPTTSEAGPGHARPAPLPHPLTLADGRRRSLTTVTAVRWHLRALQGPLDGQMDTDPPQAEHAAAAVPPARRHHQHAAARGHPRLLLRHHLVEALTWR